MWFPSKNAGSGHPHIVCPMETYISTAKKQTDALLHQRFRPEFLNRLDEIILYKPLTKKEIGGIVDLLIANLQKRLAEQQIKVTLTEASNTESGSSFSAYSKRSISRAFGSSMVKLSASVKLKRGVSLFFVTAGAAQAPGVRRNSRLSCA